MFDNYEILRKEYFEWLIRLLFGDSHVQYLYSRLLEKLHNIPFIYTIPLDKNRYMDGIDLRYRYSYEQNIPYQDVDIAFENMDCSVLEMMIALALRCEESIMSDNEYGNRIDYWFMEMLSNLKIDNMTDNSFDSRWIDYRINTFMSHGYELNGDGGLFKIPNTSIDLREVEIWDQMCWYLDTIINN